MRDTSEFVTYHHHYYHRRRYQDNNCYNREYLLMIESILLVNKQLLVLNTVNIIV